MTKALLIIDVQNDFCEGGSLPVTGGAAVATAITNHLAKNGDEYSLVIASRDWHDADNDNGGHFAKAGTAPDFVNNWPAHCVSGTTGAEYHPNLNTGEIDVHVEKGQGHPSYSAFEGATRDGKTLEQVLKENKIDELDVAGLATDYCVLASSLDAVNGGFKVNLLTELIAGIASETSEAAIGKMAAAGCKIA
jgi:nicotinamidase/pyrazinamidase